MTKVTFGRETIPFDTKEEWEDFWRNLCISDYPFLHAQDSWNTYNTALQEIKNGKKETDWMWFTSNPQPPSKNEIELKEKEATQKKRLKEVKIATRRHKIPLPHNAT